MKWAMGIMRASNGFILKWYDEDDEGREYPQTLVIEEVDGELKAAQKMLWEVLEYFGIYHSKHNKENLVIKIEGEDDEG